MSVVSVRIWCVCSSQVPQVVQKAPSQSRFGKVTEGCSSGGDSGPQRRQPRCTGDTNSRQVVSIRQPGNQHERSGVRGDVGSTGGGRTAKSGRWRGCHFTIVAVQHAPIERSTHSRRRRGNQVHSNGRCHCGVRDRSSDDGGHYQQQQQQQQR